MINTNQLSALVSVFRVETEKESISPETVGNATKIFLSLTKHDVRTCEDFPRLGSVSIAAANATQAGAMTAALAALTTNLTPLNFKPKT